MTPHSKQLPERAAELSEKELSQVVGGFNPQPDPPAILVGQTRVTPSAFGIRAGQIGG
jgi:bacteriocin-like protein